jgi:hypothetical protein
MKRCAAEQLDGLLSAAATSIRPFTARAASHHLGSGHDPIAPGGDGALVS